MTRISTFTFKGQDVDILYHNGKISFIFETKGKRFGNAVKVESRKTKDIIDAVFALLLNFAETLESAQTHDSK